MRGLLFLLVALLAGSTAAAAAETRVALVIGNAAYKLGPLKNPINDARAMSASLKALGFEVIEVENAGRKRMQQSLRQFADKLTPEAVGVFYYSGHGLQSKGVNYLVPPDAIIRSEAEMDEEALSLNAVLLRLDEAKNRLNIVILDACRDNPFARSFRSGAQGLGQVDAPTGTLIAYSTAPGRTASDGAGANGLYTAALLESMRLPGLSVEAVFKQVRVAVQTKSAGQQVPWESSSLTGDFYFAGGGNRPAAATLDREAALWQAIKDSRTASAFQAYLDEFPEGAFVGEARSRLAGLGAPAPTPATQRPPSPGPRPSAPGARAFDGSWRARYECAASRRGDEFVKRAVLLVENGEAVMEFGAADSPGWSRSVVRIADDGAIKVNGEGISGQTERDFAISLSGRIAGNAGKASGSQSRRSCTLTLERQ
jgi:hypothetical protein